MTEFADFASGNMAKCPLTVKHTNFQNLSEIDILISDFECDECNKTFGKYESALAFYLGPPRAFHGLNEDEGTTGKFKSPNKQVVTEKLDFYGAKNCVSISREDCLDQTFEIDRENRFN